MPYQSTNLPTSINIAGIDYGSICVSDLGTGGGIEGDPYLTPLQHIAVNNTDINDNIFNNIEPLIYSNFNINSGFLKSDPIITGSLDNVITLSGSTVDNLSRGFYTKSSQELNFSCEGLQDAVPRKVFIPILAKIKDKSSSIFQYGEYIMIIFSRATIIEKENITGTNAGNSISIFRLKNRPIIK